MPEPDCFLRYRISAATGTLRLENKSDVYILAAWFYNGFIHWASEPSKQFCLRYMRSTECHCWDRSTVMLRSINTCIFPTNCSLLQCTHSRQTDIWSTALWCFVGPRVLALQTAGFAVSRDQRRRIFMIVSTSQLSDWFQTRITREVTGEANRRRVFCDSDGQVHWTQSRTFSVINNLRWSHYDDEKAKPESDEKSHLEKLVDQSGRK